MSLEGPFAFRPAGPDDIAELGRLARSIWLEAYREILSPGQIEYMLLRMYHPDVLRREMEEGVLWDLARCGGMPVGFLSYGATAADEAKIHKLYLDASVRGRGLSARAIARVEAWSRGRGFLRLTLNVNRNNKRAIRAYEKNGFRNERSGVFDIGGGYVMDDRIMVKFLAAREPQEP
jgi:GNAT superfamily N-acetyltransferase